MTYTNLEVNKKSMQISKNFYINLDADRRIPSGAKLLLRKIIQLSAKKGFCWATNKTLAEMFEAAARTVQRWIRALKDLGYIKVEIVYKEDTKEVVGRKIFVGAEGQT